MTNYRTATPKDLTELLIKYGEVTFAAEYNTDDDGTILEGENWFGAKIQKQFEGSCLLVSSYGGDIWFPYSISSPNDKLSSKELEQAFRHLLINDMAIPDGIVCIEVSATQLERERLEKEKQHVLMALGSPEGCNQINLTLRLDEIKEALKNLNPDLDTDSFEYERIKTHAGHNVEVTVYGGNVNVSIECVDCNEVLFSADNPKVACYA